MPEVLPGRGTEPDGPPSRVLAGRAKKGRTGENRENREEIANLRFEIFQISKGRDEKIMKERGPRERLSTG